MSSPEVILNPHLREAVAQVFEKAVVLHNSGRTEAAWAYILALPFCCLDTRGRREKIIIITRYQAVRVMYSPHVPRF